MTILLDTNIVIEHLKHGMLADVSPEIKFAISVISVTELFRFAGMAQIEESLIEEFLLITQIFSLDSSIARRAGYLGRTRSTKLADLMIAATALEWNIAIVTKNLKDFRNIPGLKVQTAP